MLIKSKEKIDKWRPFAASTVKHAPTSILYKYLFPSQIHTFTLNR